jgi:hypothetical protein
MMGLLLVRQPYSRKMKTDKKNIFCPGCDEQNRANYRRLEYGALNAKDGRRSSVL